MSNDKFVPLSMLLEQLKHITEEQIKHAPTEQLDRLCDELVRLFGHTMAELLELEDECTSPTVPIH